MATRDCSSFRCKKPLCNIHVRVTIYGSKVPAMQGKVIFSCPHLTDLGLEGELVLKLRHHPCRTPRHLNAPWCLEVSPDWVDVPLMSEGTPFYWPTDPIR